MWFSRERREALNRFQLTFLSVFVWPKAENIFLFHLFSSKREKIILHAAGTWVY